MREQSALIRTSEAKRRGDPDRRDGASDRGHLSANPVSEDEFFGGLSLL